ncbi:LysR family transcriptional regulator [Pseudomonas sp. LB-090624]|uniref:LysR family transcriptional regulator n=1 Tax=Pseudomonas sp. LB-090624 TaxID=2213079 RepID=UPI002113D65B|nr:LysR family transcriptional regulator [Pseudomonas sp. LB-090624]
MREVMHLKAHRYFVMVAVTGSFAATARHFQVPASSVSRFIAALEKELGQQLLYRNTRAVRLTDAGERYFQQIREVLELLDAANEDLGGKGSDIRGLVKINAPVALGRLHIVRLVERLYAEYPELVVELTLSDLYIDPVQEGVDITIRVGHLESSALIGRKICDQRYVLCASAEYVALHGAPQCPEDLKAHNCLVYKGQGGMQRWHFRLHPEDEVQVINVQGPFRSNNAEALVEAALGGMGIVLFPSWLLGKEHFVNGQFIQLLPEWRGSIEPVTSQIHLISPENRLRSKKVSAVSAFLLDAIGFPPYWDDLG